MYSYGKKSRRLLESAHPDLKLIMNESIKFIDISIIDSLRTDARQLELYNKGRSTINGIDKKSNHQGKVILINNVETLVSFALDIIPYKKGLDPFGNTPKNLARYYFMMGIIDAVALRLLEEGKIKSKVRFGLDWDGDRNFEDQNFDDLPHLEIIPI